HPRCSPGRTTVSAEDGFMHSDSRDDRNGIPDDHANDAQPHGDRGHLRGFASERRDLVAGLRGPLDEEAAGPTGGAKDDDVHGLCLRPYAHDAPLERRAVLGSERAAEIANLTRGPGARFELASRDPQPPSITRLAHPGRPGPHGGGEYSILLAGRRSSRDGPELFHTPLMAALN